MQIGYNLGRIAEITGLGRNVWDFYKGDVEISNWGNLFHQITLFEIDLNETGDAYRDPHPVLRILCARNSDSPIILRYLLEDEEPEARKAAEARFAQNAQ